MNRLEDAKKIYETINPPLSYGLMIERSIEGKVPKNKKTNHYIRLKFAIASTAAVFIMCVVLLNTSAAFATAVYKIPLVGDLARLFTFREYQLSATVYDIQVEMPAIRNTGDTAFEKQINNQIQDKIDSIVAKAKLRGNQVIEDQLASGGKEADLIPFHVLITYDIKSSDENILSFVINDTESAVTSYTYQNFYNIDLNTHKEMTLSDKLGEAYSEIIVDSVQKQILNRVNDHPEWSYYPLTEGDLEGMVKSMKFYINDDGNAVISFDKGEIAPPPMGIQEFIIIP